MKIISQTSNRIIVGAPTCKPPSQDFKCTQALHFHAGRDPEYMALNIQFAIDVMIGAKVINLFPNFLKPYVAQCHF